MKNQLHLQSTVESFQQSNTNYQQFQQQQQQTLQPIQELTSLNRKGSIMPRSCKTEGHGVSATVCANCSTTTTPLWRRAPNGETICNACGLYLKARNTVRPPWLKRNAIKKAVPVVPETTEESNNGTCPGDGHCDGTGGSNSCDGCPAYNQHQVNRQALICANCGTNTTPLWRRDEAGNTICNACGLYFKLHNVHRPVTMKRSVIKRRKRVTLATSPPPTTPPPSTPPPSTHQPGGSDNEHSSRKSRVYNHPPPPTPSSTSGSDRGSYSDDDYSIEDFEPSNRKRNVIDHVTSNKRICSNGSRQRHPVNAHEGRSLSPVEPTLNSDRYQVHIYQNNRLMGAPRASLPSVYSNQCDGPLSPDNNSPTTSSINSLLNPSSPTTGPPQLPPLSSIPSAGSTITPSAPSVTPILGLPHLLNGASVSANQHQQNIPFSNTIPEQTITQQVLQARQELQREVSHLSMLLNRTTAILVGLDQAMANNMVARTGFDGSASNVSLPSISYGPSSSDSNSLSNNAGHIMQHQKVGLPTPPVNAGMCQKSYMSNMTLPPLSPSTSEGQLPR